MAALISEHFKFAALFFKSKDVVLFNGLIALGTVASQTAYNIFAFECPCSSQRNYLYGLAAIGAPAIALFIVGLILNRNTWDLISECCLRKCRKLSLAAAFVLLGSIMGRAIVAPITWSVISLLQGEAYVCVLSEFMDPQIVENLSSMDITPNIMARFPYKDVPAELLPFWRQIERHLKYESQYNKMYALVVMFVPPIILFLLGILVNRHTGVMMEEWARPAGKRTKNPAVIKYLFSAMIQRAMLAPMVWILVSLLDGKCFVCAFSMSVDPKHFSGFPNNTGLELVRIMAKVPCKEDIIFKKSAFPKGVSRYVKCYSQAIGWSILLCLIFLGAVGRVIKPCFNYANFLQTRYWSNYLDVEQKLFDETCVLHAREFAKKCVVQFFEGIQDDSVLTLPLAPNIRLNKSQEEGEEKEEHLHGVTKKEQVDHMLQAWFQSRPELDVTKIVHRPSKCIGWEDPNGGILYSDV